MSLSVPIRKHDMYNLDILTHIARYIPFDLLPNLLQWPQPASNAVKPATRHRVWQRLKPYIPKAARPFFFPNLSSSGGALFGDFVLQVLLGVGDFEKIYKSRRDLEIIVRHAHEEPMLSFFEDIGYESRQVPTPELLQDTVELTQELVKEVGDEVYRVKLYTSKSQAIAVVTGSPFTAYWNAITANEIVVFCPRTTFANKSLVCDWYTSLPDSNLSFEILRNNEGWKTDCKGECPMLHRKTFEDAGASVYQWSPQTEKNESSGWGDWSGSGWGDDYESERRIRNSQFCSSQAIQWRVSHRCYNSLCDNSIFAAARRRVIPNA